MGRATGNDTAITPGRRTHVILDDIESVITEETFGLERAGEDMGLSTSGRRDRVVSVPGLGLRLSSYEYTPEVGLYGTSGNNLTYESPGDITVPAEFVFTPIYRKLTELIDAYNDERPGIDPVGDYYYQKQVTAGSSWEIRLVADEAAFPGPEFAADPDFVKLDRVCVGVGAHRITQPLTFTLITPPMPRTIKQRLARFYFSGPYGSDEVLRGYGQYAISVYGNGRTELFERGLLGPDFDTVGWAMRASYRLIFTPGQENGFVGQLTRLSVWPNPYKSAEGQIYFTVESSQIASVDNATPVRVGVSIIESRGTSLGNFTKFRPIRRTAGGAQIEAPVRVDMARDLRGGFKIAGTRFSDEGYVADEPFMIPQLPTTESPVRLEVYYIRGTGTTLTPVLSLLNDDGTDNTVLSPTATGDIGGELGKYFDFDLPAGNFNRYFRVQVTFGGDETDTDTLVSYRVIKNGALAEINNTEKSGGVTTFISIIGPDSDATHESVGFGIKDPAGEVDVLRVRGSVPYRIETEYDAADDEKRCVLSRGYVEEAEAEYKRGSGTKGRGAAGGTANYPGQPWYTYICKGIGKWKRIAEARAPKLFSFANDPLAGGQNWAGKTPIPYKVTVILESIFGWAGFDSTQRDVEDQPWRLFPALDGASYLVRPNTDLPTLAMRLARDYLGAVIVRDENAGTKGKWKVIIPPKGPYTNVAAFTTARAPNGSIFSLPSYPDTELEEVEADLENGIPGRVEATVPTAPIVSLTSKQRAPEANKLIVSGSGVLAGSSGLMRLTQVYQHAKSYNFSPDIETADPESPDYLGREVQAYYIDKMLTTPEAVNFVMRRLIPLVCYGYTLVTLVAPLVLIEHEDDAERVRPLRFGDPVVVISGGEIKQYIVRSCNPNYRKDAHQMATYELQSVVI